MTKKVTTKVFVGSMLFLLATLPAAVLAQEGQGTMGGETMMAAVSCQQDYTVQADDWLSKIAEKFYGDVLAYPAIVQATNAHYEATMMAEDPAMMAEDDKAMAEGKLMVEDSGGQMMEAMMTDGGKLMVKDANGQMIEVAIGAEGHLMTANDSMLDGKLVLKGADGQMVDVMMVDDKLMTKDTNGHMMEVAMEDKAMTGETMDSEMMADQAMTGNKMMMTGSYAHIENPDRIEPGWVLCIPHAEDAQNLLTGGTAAMTK